MKLGSLLSARCRHRSTKSSRMKGHTSLSTALVSIMNKNIFISDEHNVVSYLVVYNTVMCTYM